MTHEFEPASRLNVYGYTSDVAIFSLSMGRASYPASINLRLRSGI